MIEQQALIVIKQDGRRIPAIKLSGQLQHVVSAAAFRRIYALLQLSGQTPRRSEPRFRIARPACDIGASGRDFIKEVLGQIAKTTVARDLVSSGGRNYLRDMRVDMQSLQLIPPRCQWIDEALLLEAVAQFRPPNVVRLRRKMIEALGDAAELDRE